MISTILGSKWSNGDFAPSRRCLPIANAVCICLWLTVSPATVNLILDPSKHARMHCLNCRECPMKQAWICALSSSIIGIFWTCEWSKCSALKITTSTAAMYLVSFTTLTQLYCQKHQWASQDTLIKANALEAIGNINYSSTRHYSHSVANADIKRFPLHNV